MRVGPLRYRLTVQQKVAGSPQQKPSGEPDKTWSALGTIWADVRPLRGNSLFVAQQINARIEVEIDLRYTGIASQITAGMRLVHGSTYYEIEHVPPLAPRGSKVFTLGCSTGVTEG
jgi:SPP1 family predicted phage head-tail adaptor